MLETGRRISDHILNTPHGELINALKFEKGVGPKSVEYGAQALGINFTDIQNDFIDTALMGDTLLLPHELINANFELVESSKRYLAKRAIDSWYKKAMTQQDEWNLLLTDDSSKVGLVINDARNKYWDKNIPAPK